MVESLIIAAASNALAPGVSATVAPSAPGDWLAPSGNDARVAIVLVAATLLYLAYHLAIAPAVVTRLFPERTTTEPELRTTVAFFRKAVGSALFGVLPAIAIASAWPGGLAACGVSLVEAPRSLLYALAFIALMVPLLLMQTRKPSFRQHYPEVRRPLIGPLAAHNAVAWAAYLVGYEFFFRGVLVLGLAPIIGPLPALTLSLMGYVFVHLGRYAGETIGTLFTGTLFGIVALETGSILMPIAAHLGMALLSDHLAGRPLPTDADG